MLMCPLTNNLVDPVKKKTWRVSLSIGVRPTMIRRVVYLLRIFKMFHGLMNNTVYMCAHMYIYIYECVCVSVHTKIGKLHPGTGTEALHRPYDL